MMKFATLMSGAIALPLLFAAPALAQTSDQRVLAMEDQLRQLNGLVEELNFQVLQMQDQLRRMQEDNEFRFQELEGGGGTGSRSGASSNDQGNNTLMPPATTDTADAESHGTIQPPVAGGSSETLGAPPRELGSITFDAQGNPVGAGVAQPVAPQPGIAGAPSDGTTVAALPAAGDAGQLYRNSYEFILSGDYATAEAGFRDMIARYPENEQIPDAQFWLGEALLGQEKYRDAAETFLAASRDHPQSRRAPEMLFKLGVSLAALNQREVACATFNEVGQRYPQMSEALKERVEQEKQLTSC
ncbi:tol-pal system protein YbgF [Mesorhizobium sp. YIM 152430]|uniref:tol-pal system protein YbgF n=1 Tax=Mesorhizobium sp. YIM 152430 TaxID=3031761 RepID=UPI0031F44E80